jgi:hypothetical protein
MASARLIDAEERMKKKPAGVAAGFLGPEFQFD